MSVLSTEQVDNKEVIDRRLRPRCCHLGSYFKHKSFSCRYMRRDIMRKHDVTNIQHTHCSPVGLRSSPKCPLPATGVPTRQAHGCVLASQPQPGGDVEQPQLMCKYDIVHKTGNRPT